MKNSHESYGVYEKYIKRCLDVVLSVTAIVLLFWLLIIISIFVKIKLGSPIVFKQERPGKDGKIFKMYKFRTMLPPQTRNGKILTDRERLECVERGIDILSDEERLTKFGRFLRATSLDELPELFNIVNGTMSIVGPRPLATIYLPYYTDKEMHRHDVRPGLTGLAQVHGRNSASWEERFEYDLEYVNHITFIGDIKIILDTIGVVFAHRDIGQGTDKPEPFNVQRQRQMDELK